MDIDIHYFLYRNETDARSEQGKENEIALADSKRSAEQYMQYKLR
jgi:hypothetical protein